MINLLIDATKREMESERGKATIKSALMNGLSPLGAVVCCAQKATGRENYEDLCEIASATLDEVRIRNMQ